MLGSNGSADGTCRLAGVAVAVDWLVNPGVSGAAFSSVGETFCDAAGSTGMGALAGTQAARINTDRQTSKTAGLFNPLDPCRLTIKMDILFRLIDLFPL